MAKIPKNLDDKAMFAGFKEEVTFETMFLAEEEAQPPKPKAKGKEKESLAASFVTKELQEKLGNLLLELKLELYKEGLVDYQVKAVREGKRIILSPSPVKKRTK